MKDGDVKALCSKQVFEGAVGYFRQGRVSNTQVHEMTLYGDVKGSELGDYKVKIEYEEGGELIPKCTCPFDMEEFCKHSIALLLHWIHKREKFLEIDLVLKDLKGKSKEELLRLIQEGIKVNPSIIFYLYEHGIKRSNEQLEVLFSNYVGYYDVHKLIEKLEEARGDSERLFDRKNAQDSFSPLKAIIDLCVKNYGNVDDSDGMLARFIEESLKLYARIIQVLNVEFSVKRKIHEENWRMFVSDKYGLSDYFPSMIMNTCITENDFILIEKLASEELQKRKSKADEGDVSEIVDILLDLYEKREDREKFLLLCEKEFRHSYMRYIKYLEAEGKIDEAAQCCTRAIEFARGFMKTEIIEKLGDLKHAQRFDVDSLSLYVDAFKDLSEMELFGKIRHLSQELGSWKDVKDDLTSFLEQREDSHNLIEIYLQEGDLVSASKIALLYITNRYDAERVAKACEKSLPDKAAEIYQSMAEVSIKQSDRNGYRAARSYYKTMKRIYRSLGKAEDFRYYIDGIRLANKRKPALQEELSKL